jgi:hypothetical protein
MTQLDYPLIKPEDVLGAPDQGQLPQMCPEDVLTAEQHRQRQRRDRVAAATAEIMAYNRRGWADATEQDKLVFLNEERRKWNLARLNEVPKGPGF